MGPQGQPRGQFTADLAEIDSVLRRARTRIYDGTCTNIADMVDTFMDKYKRHIYKAEASTVEVVNADMVHDAFSGGGKSAAGLDSCESEELALMSRYACAWCARLYQTIEDEADWPEGTQKAKAVFLEKEGALPGEVMPYKVLLVMAVLYRKWPPGDSNHWNHGSTNGPCQKSTPEQATKGWKMHGIRP